MALAPGETNESFIREVDENLRRSQAESFFKRWGKWLIAAVVLLLIGSAALIWWRAEQRDRAAEQSQALSAVIDDVARGNTANVDQRLARIAEMDPDGYGGLARMTGAAVALQKNDRAKAIAAYAAVAGDEDQPDAIRNAALVRQTALEFDSLQPDQVIARLQPLAQPGNAWFGAAGEMTAMAMIKANRRAQAGRLFGQIAADRSVPDSLRARAVQIAGTLGVDATAAMPAAATQ